MKFQALAPKPAHAAVFALIAALAGCGQLIAGYSLQAYQNTTTAKADVASLVDQSTAAAYADRKSQIDMVTLKLNEAAEFSRGEGSNQITTAQWDLVLQPNGNLYYAFLHAWQRHGTLNATEAGTWKTLLDRAFDYMICLEANKQSSSPCAKPEALPGATASQ